MGNTDSFAHVTGSGLLNSNGAYWTRHRKMLTPAFHFDVLKPYVGVFNEVSRILLVRGTAFVYAYLQVVFRMCGIHWQKRVNILVYLSILAILRWMLS